MLPPFIDQAIETAFPESERDVVRGLLDDYGMHPHEREVDRVRWVIVQRARGSLDRVRSLVAMAKTDHRDVLVVDPGYYRLLARADVQPLPQVDTMPLFRPLWQALLSLLEGLAPADWTRPTVAPAWRVRDVAAHLLDGDLRKVAAYRDRHLLAPDRAITSERALGDFINALNASGVGWSARLSPRIITDLLRITGPWVADLLGSIPPGDRSLFAVSWAGEAESEQWMDTGREYTERWHHQMQIRDAVGAPLLLGPVWMVPLVEFSLRALPRALADVPAPVGATLGIDVHGETIGAWTVRRDVDGWRLLRGRPDAADALVRVDADVAWRIFYNAMTVEEARARIEVQGDPRLVEPLLAARSVIL